VTAPARPLMPFCRVLMPPASRQSWAGRQQARGIVL